MILAELKAQLNEKKFNNRVKKAIKVLKQGLEKKKTVKKKAEKPAKAGVKAKKSEPIKKIAKKA